MSNESHVMALLEEGNPATEISDNAWSQLDAAAYLATLHKRSSEMTQLNTRDLERIRDPEIEKRGSRWVAVLVAALLAVVLGTTVVLISQGTEESPVATEPPPTTEAQTTTTEAQTTTTEAQTTTTEAQTTTTTTTVESPLADVPTWFGQGDPGIYKPSRFSLPFSFTLSDSGWESGTDLESKFAICGPDVTGPVGARSACFRASAVAVFLLELETVEDTQAYLGTFPGAEIGNVESTSIDGAEGVRFSFTHELIPHSNIQGGFDGYPYWQHETQELPLGGDESIVTIVDVEGTIVTAVYQGRNVLEPAAFDANLAEGMAIVDSIVWGE